MTLISVEQVVRTSYDTNYTGLPQSTKAILEVAKYFTAFGPSSPRCHDEPQYGSLPRSLCTSRKVSGLNGAEGLFSLMLSWVGLSGRGRRTACHVKGFEKTARKLLPDTARYAGQSDSVRLQVPVEAVRLKLSF